MSSQERMASIKARFTHRTLYNLALIVSENSTLTGKQM